MNFAKRNIDVLSNAEIHNLRTHGNPCLALHNDPVFSSLVVFLQAELLPRVHQDPLNLITRPLGNCFIPTPPRAMGA